MNYHIDPSFNTYKVRKTDTNELVGIYTTEEEAIEALNRFELGQYAQYADMPVPNEEQRKMYIYSLRSEWGLKQNIKLMAYSLEHAKYIIHKIYPNWKLYYLKLVEDHNKITKELIHIDFKNKAVIARRKYE